MFKVKIGYTGRGGEVTLSSRMWWLMSLSEGSQGGRSQVYLVGTEIKVDYVWEGWKPQGRYTPET